MFIILMLEVIIYVDIKCIGIYSEEMIGFLWCIDRYIFNWIKYYVSVVGKGVFFWVFIKFYCCYICIVV